MFLLPESDPSLIIFLL